MAWVHIPPPYELLILSQHENKYNKQVKNEEKKRFIKMYIGRMISK